MYLLLLLVTIYAASATLPACKEGEYEYEFTECDSAGGRWRVPVPRKPEQCETTGLASVRQRKCASACDPGKYLDVNSPEQSCKPCKAGHYSLGGDVIYTNWTTLPSGFETQSFDDSHSQWSRNKKSNCTNSLWKATGDYLVSSADACTSQLTLAVTLKKDGLVTFKYQSSSSDVFFYVYVRNEQCMMTTGQQSYKYPERTKEFHWRNESVHLKRGHNLIVWQASLFPTNMEGERNKEPVLMKSIRVQGVAYTSECTPCSAGTFAKFEGTRSCTPCPANQYSAEGATECKKCDTNTEYSKAGSAKCFKRLPCTINDYIETHSACDVNNKFKKMFHWIEPKICVNNVKDSTSLPESGKEEECAPCNPGMFKNGTRCDFCPPMTYSDGKATECTKCSASTEPEYGFYFNWWRSWPENMDHMCESSYERGCATEEGFRLHGNSIDSGYGHADDAKVLLFLGTDGFKTSNLYPKLGTVTFEFEVQCEGPCHLSFYQMHNERSRESGRYEKIKEWNGKQSKQKYVFMATTKHTEGFYWVFRKGEHNARRDDDSSDDTDHFNYRNDKVIFYFIKVTKTVDGGAAGCKKCPIGMEDEGCIPCPKGNRITSDQNGKPKCEACPKNTYLNASDPYGKRACIPCGDKLTSKKGSTQCESDCKFSSKEGRHYDLTPLSGFHSLKTSALFTSQGTKYYHHFNISFCQKGPLAKASCYRNVSMNGNLQARETFNYSICRMTIIPKRETGNNLAAQPMSVGEQLMLIATREVKANDEILSDKDIVNTTVVSFYYQTNDFTEACPKGRSTVIHHVCHPHHKPKEAKLAVPEKCSEGTCDGCSFHFIMYSSAACPLCTSNDYDSVVTGCVKGQKVTTFVWKMPKVCVGGASLPKKNSTECTILERSVKDFAIGLSLFAGFVILMVLAVLILWYKNRRLEYKYHKLIQNSSDRSGELPGAPQCVGDDDDDEEEVHFKGGEGRGKRFLKNIKSKFSGDTKFSDQYNFNNFSDDDFGSIEPTAKTPLS